MWCNLWLRNVNAVYYILLLSTFKGNAFEQLSLHTNSKAFDLCMIYWKYSIPNGCVSHLEVWPYPQTISAVCNCCFTEWNSFMILCLLHYETIFRQKPVINQSKTAGDIYCELWCVCCRCAAASGRYLEAHSSHHRRMLWRTGMASSSIFSTVGAAVK